MQSIRNIAIIAHVDHGKTTLVDRILKECRAIDQRSITGNLILDSNELERERGITILAKNIAVEYNGVKINLIDTPGHADFGGEVERVLTMADGVLLLVDAFEGPMPQTRFVLQKAINLGLKPIVVINKVDKENCKPGEVQQDVFDLMYNLNANNDQLDFETFFGSSKYGWMSTDPKQTSGSIKPLLDSILRVIREAPCKHGTLQLQIASLDYSNYLGRIAIGRVFRGEIETDRDYILCKKAGVKQKVRIRELYTFLGLGRVRTEKVRCGDICAVVGLDDFEIGDTIADAGFPEQLPRISVDEPTMSMLFMVNNSPFFGQEGKYSTSRHLRNRLLKETEKNLALRVGMTDREDSWLVHGRGILHLSILIETMRREGFEFQIGKPRVILREINGVNCEPFETLVIDIPGNYSGKTIDLITQRKGTLEVMEPKSDLLHLEFEIPARGLIGLRNSLLTSASGEVVINHRFRGYEPWAGDIRERQNGAIISIDSGQASAYAINRLKDRGVFFINPGEMVYKGMIVGEHTRPADLEVNMTRGKKLTNMRASGSDENIKLAPPLKFSLEEAMEYIRDDEYLEVTPISLRMRKI